MITIGKLTYLHIDKSSFSFIRSGKGSIDYHKWVEYINDNQDFFVWFEDTEDGKYISTNIETIPEKFQEIALASLNKVRCYAKFNPKKNYYDISAACSEGSGRVTITFERRPKIEEIRMFLDMAKYLDAMLLYRGKTIIDEKVIEELENNSKMRKKGPLKK
ncbi:hypothetical protein [Bacteroides sp. Marseille-P3684]|uniref:hypothetical protein n=1 Tax=Bacteroides sp. Marseille-P3684 TaxID=2086579 RepID=UPI000D113FF6|nr:hypothetical protein [Bacteroides sp. Marseille-P3684]